MEIETAAEEIESSGVVKAAAVLAIGNVASRILGLVRETVKANLFGASPLLAAYEVAAYIPNSLYDLIIGGMVNSSLVPVFSDYATKERRQELWALLSMVLSAATVLLLLVVGVVELFTPQVAWLMGARNFDDPALTAVTVRLIRLATPAVFFMSIASIFTGVLYALKRFTIPAFMGATLNGTIVIIALLRQDEVDSLIWGLLAGSLLQILLQWPALGQSRLRWQLEWRHPAIRRILQLYAPIVGGLIINQLAYALSINLATRIGDASVTYMRFATTLYQFPLGLIVTALSIATLPTLSRQALGQLDAFKSTLAEGTRLVITLIMPATAGLFALAAPIIALLFQHGEFTAQDTVVTTLALQAYLFGLPFAAVDQMLIFASYARKDTLRPALVGVVSILLYLGTAVLLQRPLGSIGHALGQQMGLAGFTGLETLGNGLLSLMVADSLKHMIHTALMIWILQRHLHGLGGYGVAGAALKSFAAALMTGIVAYGTAVFLTPLLPTTLVGKFGLVLVAGSAGVLAYMLMVFLLDIKEAKALPRLLRRRS
ncbi:MAG: murein biosynthesis integral membrane protein MurJ [Ardenticatenaceae bacterium]|nr:murein biosynthesis integral membrane protein MurJ [Ardenticatenaceae bacterium]